MTSISQGIAAKQLMGGGIFIHHFIEYLHLNVPDKWLWSGLVYQDTHCVSFTFKQIHKL